MANPSEPPEHRFTLDLLTGEIRSAGEPQRREQEWIEIGEIDPASGRSTVDLEKARRWRSLWEYRR